MKIKNIFQKNQVIIFALAIMICVAGYLNFSSDKAKEDKKEEEASTEINKELFSDLEGDLLVDTDISDEDMLESNKEVIGEGVLVNDPISSETNLLKDQVPENKEDKKDEDKTKDDSTKKTESVNPGEAILTSTIAGSDFATARLKREQIRAKNREDLMNIVNDTSISEEKKQDAIDAVLQLNDIAERENTTEILLEAKGYSGAVVCILDDSVDVIINSESLSDQDLAIIEDVVVRKTGADLKNVKITPVISQD